MTKVPFLIFGLIISNITFAGCPSEATIDVQSSTYSGSYNIELRSGQRPGSSVVGTQFINKHCKMP